MIDTRVQDVVGNEHDDTPGGVLYCDLKGVLGPTMCLGEVKLVGDTPQPDRKA